VSENVHVRSRRRSGGDCGRHGLQAARAKEETIRRLLKIPGVLPVPQVVAPAMPLAPPAPLLYIFAISTWWEA